MNEKYYTPEIKDLFVGYECEHSTMMASFDATNKRDVLLLNDDDVKKGELADHELIEYIKFIAEEDYDVSKFIRTMYLTKEQIVSEGWQYKREYSNIFHFELGNVWDGKTKGGFLEYNIQSKILKITLKEVGEYTMDGPKISIRFNGCCPSINEFRKICKLVLS